MTSLNSAFDNLGRLGADKSDNSQRNQSNTKYANYTLENHMQNTNSNEHVQFATNTLTMNFKNSVGGLPANAVDYDSLLSIKAQQQREFEKLQLHPRPFATVPYLGKGGANPDMESKLLHGEMVTDRKSQSTIMDKSYIDYNEYPLMDDVKKRINDPSKSIEELALHGWRRGGVATREINISEN